VKRDYFSLCCLWVNLLFFSIRGRRGWTVIIFFVFLLCDPCDFSPSSGVYAVNAHSHWA